MEAAELTPRRAPSADGSEASASSSRAPRRRRRSRSSSATPREKANPVITEIDEELARLRAEVAERGERAAHAQEELEAAKAEERRRAQTLKQVRLEMLARRSKLTRRFQAAVRGWLGRRRFVRDLNHRLGNQVGIVALLPDQLHDSLKALQHHIHELKYTPEDRLRAAVQVQGWWRSVIGRRVVYVLQVASKMRSVYGEMVAAAMRIQAWYRAYEARRRFRVQILINMGLACSKHMEEMEILLKVVIRLQRSIRAKLARRRVEDQRRMIKASGQRTLMGLKEIERYTRPLDPGIVQIDSWKPGGVSAVVAALADPKSVVEDKPPKTDHELERLEEVGLTPFYWSAAGENVRHRVGGPTALRMRKRLGLAGWRAAESSSGEEEEPLGNVADVYPQGLSAGFLDNLDDDAWPWERRARDRRLQKRAARRAAAAPPCRLIVPPPPSNAERRAREREEARETAAAGVLEVANEATVDLHPLLANAPLLELAPAPPPGPPPRGRPRPPLGRCAPAAAGEDEDSWSGATSFFGGGRPRKPKKPLQASAGGWSVTPVEQRLGVSATGHQLLALAC